MKKQQINIVFSFHKEVPTIWKAYMKNWGWKRLETFFAHISEGHHGFDLNGLKSVEQLYLPSHTYAATAHLCW